MKYEIKSPCASCPYRKDASLAFWSREEFANLLAQDRTPMNMGNPFACHEGKKKPVEDRDLCAGWALDQKKRGIPSIKLRLILLRNDKAMECFDSLTDGGHKLYKSMLAMIQANYPGEFS